MNKDLEILAQAASSDASAPSSMSALYHGAIHDETELLIALTTRMDDTIIEDRFQYSYKLYNSNFPLISAPNKSCYTEWLPVYLNQQDSLWARKNETSLISLFVSPRPFMGNMRGFSTSDIGVVKMEWQSHWDINLFLIYLIYMSYVQ